MRKKECEEERDIYESSSRFKNYNFSKCILRDSIRYPRLAVKKTHATPMPRQREREREREVEKAGERDIDIVIRSEAPL